MRVSLPYGESVQTASIDHAGECRHLFVRSVPEPAPLDALLDGALEHPIASPGLADFIEGGRRVVVLVPDRTRYCMLDRTLRPVLDRIHDSGIPAHHVTIVIANGTHAPQSEEERRALLGGDICDAYTVVEHRAKVEEDCVHVGTTRYGTDVKLNRVAAEADRVVVVGTVVHHYFAGFGGGPKMFLPGVAAYSSALANHRRTLLPDGGFHPGCRDGAVEGNPVAEDILDAVRFFPPTFYIAVLFDEERRPFFAVSGDLVKAHRRAAEVVNSVWSVPVQQPADFVIASCGGHPRDINVIQAHKTLHHAHYALKPGGTMICLAACPEGLGNPELLRWFDYPTSEAMARAAVRDYTMNAHTAVAIRMKSESFNIILVSSLNQSAVRLMGMTPAATLQEAIDASGVRGARESRCYIIRNGSQLVPRLES